jgi:L-alanine-DL-glutamate epimerase-like enolase superfamily enzyme
VHKCLGGYRNRIKAYASTWPNMGKPEDYARHALEMKELGYKAYKVHAYIYFNPYTWEHGPQLPGFPKADIEVCRAVREAVGSDMVLMLDPFGVYTLEESIWVQSWISLYARLNMLPAVSLPAPNGCCKAPLT